MVVFPTVNNRLLKNKISANCKCSTIYVRVTQWEQLISFHATQFIALRTRPPGGQVMMLCSDSKSVLLALVLDTVPQRCSPADESDMPEIAFLRITDHRI